MSGWRSFIAWQQDAGERVQSLAKR
jgi:hypothetical protein